MVTSDAFLVFVEEEELMVLDLLIGEEGYTCVEMAVFLKHGGVLLTFLHEGGALSD